MCRSGRLDPRCGLVLCDIGGNHPELVQKVNDNAKHLGAYLLKCFPGWLQEAREAWLDDMCPLEVSQ